MERRETLRLEKTLPVRFELPDVPSAGQFEVLSRNIGVGGAFIETDLVQDEAFSLARDMPLDLELELLGRGQKIKSKARIAWLSRKSRSPRKTKGGIGIRFIELGLQEKRAIALFVSREMLAQGELIEKDIPEILREQKLSDRQRRNLQILDAIRKNRLISRAEISKGTGINIVTVSNYIDTYLKKGLIFERGLDISTGGRRPELIEINPQYGYIIGVDLGPLNVKAALMQVVATDFTSRILARAQGLRPDDNIEEALPALKDLIVKVTQSHPVQREKIRGIGVGISGIMDRLGGTVRNPLTRTTFANYLALKKELEEELGLPVFIENSASCALFAEKWTGVSLEARAADNIIYIATEHQCAIMLKGELYTGATNSAGQLILNRDSDHFPNEKSNEKWSLSLFLKIAYLVNVFNPQVVIIGAAFSRSGDAFLDTIRRTVNERSFREGANVVRIIPATLGEEATAVGAAALVIEAALANI